MKKKQTLQAHIIKSVNFNLTAENLSHIDIYAWIHTYKATAIFRLLFF